LVKDFGKFININPKKLDIIVLAAEVHDVGKFYIPKNMLLKKGKLTKNEMHIIRSHSIRSIEELKKRNMEESIINIVKHHHESYDGSGYPSGLIGEDIPFESRVIKICDVFDAITNKRVYRNIVYNYEEAIKIMENMKNEFDPILYKLFNEYIKNSNLLLKNEKIFI